MTTGLGGVGGFDASSWVSVCCGCRLTPHPALHSSQPFCGDARCSLMEIEPARHQWCGDVMTVSGASIRLVVVRGHAALLPVQRPSHGPAIGLLARSMSGIWHGHLLRIGPMLRRSTVLLTRPMAKRQRSAASARPVGRHLMNGARECQMDPRLSLGRMASCSGAHAGLAIGVLVRTAEGALP